MNTHVYSQAAFLKTTLGSLALVGWLGAALPLAAQLQPPVIESIQQQRDEIVVQVRVPAGIRRVTLECRDRLSRRSWEPRAVARLDGTGDTVTFRLPRSRQLEVLCVRGDATEPLPAQFYTGTNQFYGETVTASDGTPPGPAVFSGVPTRNTTDTTAAPESGAREVTESDIWQIRGTTLYFFNQYRGLQVIDISNPDNAVVRGQLALPAAGEQMYLLGTDHVVLLARDGCNYDQSQVLVVADRPSGPEVVTSLPIKGQIRESRMVGTALYVAAQSYRPVANTTNTAWEWGTTVAAFDLADPAAPVARNTLWYSGYGNVVAATDTYFFVVTQDRGNWWQSDVGIIDITSPDGTMHPYGSITTAGRVRDKFKLNYDGNVFTTISEEWHSSGGTRLTTRLETFNLPDPRSLGPAGIFKRGELELGRGESLRATRFDGDRVYVVTFFRIDPLWVVSLANPDHPSIVGSVDIPGWSTYIEPLVDDKLVTVGVETNRVAVSLFDVSDPAAPVLASRVLLGEAYSWSEANYDEKAFTVLPDANLILVPFNGYSTNGYSSAVQLIDLNSDTLVARGQITGSFRFRRATAYHERILSISGWELQVVDAVDRDHPEVQRRLELAWNIDRVLLSGDYLIQVQSGASWNNTTGPTLRVSPTDDPNTILSHLTLTNLPILGATVRHQLLYVAQGRAGWIGPLPLLEGDDGDDGDDGSEVTNAPNFVLTIVNLDNLPALTVAGQEAIYSEFLGWGNEWQAVWPNDDVVVWAGGGYGYWRWFDPMPVVPLGGPVAVMPMAGPVALGAPMVDVAWFAPWPFWGSVGGHLLAFEVSDPTAPEFASEVNLTTNNWWSFSQAFTANGLVFLSHQTWEYLEDDPPPPPPDPTVTSDGTAGTEVIVSRPIRRCVQRSFLDVVDYADPTDPLVRRPVSIPGTLLDVAFNANVIYTKGPHWTDTTPMDWTEYLDALAYDGVSAHLVDSLRLPGAWPHPVEVVGMNILIGNPGATDSAGTVTPNLMENWYLSAAGQFEMLSSVTLDSPASRITEIKDLVAVQESDNYLNLFVLGDATAIHRIGRGRPAGCWWYNLSRSDGSAARGLWLPLGAFGVSHIPVTP